MGDRVKEKDKGKQPGLAMKGFPVKGKEKELGVAFFYLKKKNDGKKKSSRKKLKDRTGIDR